MFLPSSFSERFAQESSLIGQLEEEMRLKSTADLDNSKLNALSKYYEDLDITFERGFALLLVGISMLYF